MVSVQLVPTFTSHVITYGLPATVQVWLQAEPHTSVASAGPMPIVATNVNTPNSETHAGCLFQKLRTVDPTTANISIPSIRVGARLLPRLSGVSTAREGAFLAPKKRRIQQERDGRKRR